MKSTMYLNNITAVDHAYINDKGMVIGGAVSPTILVEGEVEPVENVVVDFSTVKKDIKDIIDAKYSGFDHKLWLIEGYSDYELAPSTSPKNIRIKTPCLVIEAPIDAFKFIKKNGPHPENFLEQVIVQMENELHDGLNLIHRNANISVSIDFDASFIGNSRMDTTMVPFRYVHGLKDSTSWGCQNIAHGHLSYIAASGESPLAAEMVIQRIAADLDKTIFVKEENVVYDGGDVITVEYKTPRGEFMMHFKEKVWEYGRVGLIETETTIEHLAEKIAEIYQSELVEAGVNMLFVSEGLNKGAVAYIKGE